MAKPKVYADFHNADSQGRLRLNCAGTAEDLARQCVELREGLPLTLYADDVGADGELDELLVDGVATFSDDEQIWVAAIDWDAIRHSSDDRSTTVSGAAATSPRAVGMNASE